MLSCVLGTQLKGQIISYESVYDVISFSVSQD